MKRTCWTCGSEAVVWPTVHCAAHLTEYDRHHIRSAAETNSVQQFDPEAQRRWREAAEAERRVRAQRKPDEGMAYAHRWNGWRTKQPKKNPVVVKHIDDLPAEGSSH